MEIRSTSLVLTFDEIVSIRNLPVFENPAGKQFRIFRQRAADVNKLTFISNSAILPEDLSGDMTMIDGDIIASIAHVKDRSIGATFQIPQL